MDKSKKNLVIKKGLLAVFFLSAMIFASIKYSAQLIDLLSNVENLRTIILSSGNLGMLILMGLQVLQMIIPFIPSDAVQIAGGYIYGTPLSFVLLFSATIIGSAAIFYLSRYIGHPLVNIFVSSKKMDKFKFLMESKKTEIVLFILFLLPGVPKDTLVYLAGLTSIKPVRFLVIFTVAKIPGILITASIGSNIHEKNYNYIYMVIGITAILILLGFAFRKRILGRLEKPAGES